MIKHRFTLHLNCLLLISLILASCAGAPTISLPNFLASTATAPAPTAVQQAFPPALVETDPPFNSALGHLSPITFYFNQGMNKPSVESALGGLPAGTFTWNDEATVIFTPTDPYPVNSKIKISIANSIRSATGFGITEPIELSYSVSDYLFPTNLLPNANSTDVDVDAAIAVSLINLSSHWARILPRYRLPSRWYLRPRAAANGSIPARISSIPSRPWPAGRNMLSA